MLNKIFWGFWVLLDKANRILAPIAWIVLIVLSVSAYLQYTESIERLKRAGGYYSPSEQFIFVNTEDNPSFWEVQDRLVHEGGHYIFDVLLDESQRSAYCKKHNTEIAGYPERSWCTESFARLCERTSLSFCFRYGTAELSNAGGGGGGAGAEIS